MEFAVILFLAIGLYFILERVNDDKGGKTDPQRFRANSD
jgi:hypothetical protein